MNRLSALFYRGDRKPRPSKSVSSLPQLENGWTEVQDKSKDIARQRGVGSVLSQDVNRLAVGAPGQHRPVVPPPPRPGINSLKNAGPVMRASTVPTVTLHPPDELYLRVLRRRSANAMLEPQRISNEYGQTKQDETPISVVIAGALPPDYLESPPSYAYTSADRDSLYGPAFKSRGTTIERRTDELFLNPLKLQIDETIRDYSSIVVTQATPVGSVPSPIASPVNDIDQFYLERRRQRKRAAAAVAAARRQETL